MPARHGVVPNAYVKAFTEPQIDIHLYAPQGVIAEQVELQRLGMQYSRQVVLRHQRNLYGLEQDGRLRSRLLEKELLRADFVQCMADTCLYYKINSGGQFIVGA